MSASLFALVGDYRAAAEKLADMDLPPDVVADTLESISGDLEAKSLGVAHVALNFEAAAQAIREHAAMQLQRAKAMQGRADALRAYLASSLEAANIQKVEGPSLRISFRKSEAVVIDGADLLPAKFMRTPEPPPPAPDKAALKAAIKQGETIPGAHLETRRNLVLG